MSTEPTNPKPQRSPTAAQQNELDLDLERRKRDMLNDVVRKQVVRSLGSPDGLLKVQVVPIGQDRYRVNVFVGKTVTSGRIADSFFLSTDEEGTILTSSPEIVRLYELTA